MFNFFKIVGVLGIILLSIGLLKKERKVQDIYYMLGGVFLAMYSLYIGDMIFIAVQIVFTIAAAYNFSKLILHEKK